MKSDTDLKASWFSSSKNHSTTSWEGGGPVGGEGLATYKNSIQNNKILILMIFIHCLNIYRYVYYNLLL